MICVVGHDRQRMGRRHPGAHEIDIPDRDASPSQIGLEPAKPLRCSHIEWQEGRAWRIQERPYSFQIGLDPSGVEGAELEFGDGWYRNGDRVHAELGYSGFDGLIVIEKENAGIRIEEVLDRSCHRRSPPGTISPVFEDVLEA